MLGSIIYETKPEISTLYEAENEILHTKVY
jgi:hypothetical protein